jgi:biopolymer transport protein ExbD
LKKKTVHKPGYHLKPKYDLHQLRQRRMHESKGSAVAELPLVSMIDMFTILVIFLLMNFSATGEIFYMPKDVRLPEAKHAHSIDSAPLITVTANEVTLEAEKTGENPMSVVESDAALPRLSAALRQLKELSVASSPDVPFKGKINIQADENIPLQSIKRVMQACIFEGWTGINFAVRMVNTKGNNE